MFIFKFDWAQSNSDSLHKHVVRLSTMPYARNYRNAMACNKAADYIREKFSFYSQRVDEQLIETNQVQYKNIIASFGPDTAQRIIVGAHYDVFGEAPGADYNASGIAGLIELARLLKKNEKQLIYRIDLVAYALAEDPYEGTTNMGSFKHAQYLFQNRINVLGVLNLDGIGYFTDQAKSQHYPFFLYRWIHGRRGNFIALIQQPGNGLWARQMRYLMKQYVYQLRVINFKPAVPFDGFADGDIKNYWALGYAAILISDTKFYRNKNYHFDIDTFETLDYFRTAKVVDMIYNALIHYKA